MKITRKVWLIMDRNRKIIAKGVPRNRRLFMVDDPEGTTRVLTYDTKRRAESCFKNGLWFYSTTDVSAYLQKTYGFGWNSETKQYVNNQEEFMEAVEAEMTFTI